MNNISIIDVIISLFLLIFSFDYIGCNFPVTGRCGRPGLPPKASKWLISPERSRFENKEKVIILCKKDEFPLSKYEVMCKNGQWTGKQARCGRHMDAQVVHLDIFECQTPRNELLVSQPLNQSAEGPSDYPPLRPNSFHTLRVAEGLKTSAEGFNCYSYKIRFERKVQIWFILVDIWVQTNDSKVMPKLTPDLGHFRNCSLSKNTSHVMGSETVFGYYFICDLKNASDFKREELKDTITVNINTNMTETVGLEAVFIGDIYTDIIGTKTVKPECGQIQVTNIGVDAQEEVGHTYISCNESFVDTSGRNITLKSISGNPKHMFMCNWNGEWVGQWPVCVPKISCKQEDVMEEMDSSVLIEEIGNVYYLNESKWFAVNESYIRYSCLYENDIMIGKNFRTCLKSGKWSSKSPYCTRAGMPGGSIALIMFAVLIVFVLIVFFVFRTHSRRVNRELRETREEITGSQKKRFTEEFYAEFKNDNFYENTDVIPKSLDYESVEYDSVDEEPRYEIQPQNKRAPSPEYLHMLSPKLT